MNYLLVLLYIGSAATANLLVWKFGPPALIVTAILLIPIDMTARDVLQLKWGQQRWKMALLIAAGSILTLVVNPDARIIALASASAFALAGLVDWAVFGWLSHKTRMERANWSNVASSLVDSTWFPLVAFGSVSPEIALSQAALKIAGGFAFTLLCMREPCRTKVDGLEVIIDNLTEHQKRLEKTKRFVFGAKHED